MWACSDPGQSQAALSAGLRDRHLRGAVTVTSR